MKAMRFTIICLLAAISGVVISARLAPCKTAQGHKLHNTTKEICCNGMILQRQRNFECCEDTVIYDMTEQICCNGNVKEKFLNCEGPNCGEQICCGNNLFSKDKVICCDENAVFINETQKLEMDFLVCCGTELMNRSTHKCCGHQQVSRDNKWIDCCDGKTYDRHAEKCISHNGAHVKLPKYTKICGEEEYDTREKGCCSGHLYEVPELSSESFAQSETFRCCDHILMKHGEKCCREHFTGYPTHTINNSHECCGNSSINPDNEECHDGKPAPKSKTMNRCGNILIEDPLKCCAGMYSYDPMEEKCCLGSYSNSVISSNFACCNGHGYDAVTHLCCENKNVSAKGNLQDDQCCYDNNKDTYTAYNNEVQDCMEGSVQTRPLGALPCGNMYYYPDSQICCDGAIYHLSDTINSCCGSEAYNTETQMCCGWRVYNQSPEESSCCDGQMYKKGDSDNPCIQSCSAKETYDDSSQLCCQEVVHNIDHNIFDNARCCGKKVIDLRTHSCCGSQFIYKKNSKLGCCGGRELYKKPISVCRKYKVVSRDKEYRKLKDVQKLCHSKGLRYFAEWVKYSCTSKYVIAAKVHRVKIVRDGSKDQIKLSLKNIVTLSRGQGFPTNSIPKGLTFIIDVPHNDHIKCRRRNFFRSCDARIIVFFSDNVDTVSRTVRIKRNSEIYMAEYKKRRVRSLQTKLNFGFCQTHFYGQLI